MSGLFGELHRTAQALGAQSAGVFTAGRNMANVNNEAYARQRVILGDRGTVQDPLGPRSLGVEALGLQSVRDRLLDSQVLRETSTMKSLEARADADAKAQIALGQSIDSSDDASMVEGATSTAASHGIGEALDDLLNAFNGLAASPRSESERQTLFQQAQTLVSRFHSTDNRLTAIEGDIETQVGVDVDRVNDLLQAVSDLNRQIGQFEVGKPGSALDLRDQRQAKLEELSQHIDFQLEDLPGSTGQIRISSQDASGVSVTLLEASNKPTPISFDGTGISGGNPPTALALQGGSIHGLLASREGTVGSLRTKLDALAGQIVTSFNAAYNPAGNESDFFDATAPVTAANISLDASVSALNIRATTTANAVLNPGANDIALAVAGLGSRQFSTAGGDAIDGTFGSYYRSIVSDVANQTASSQGRLDDQSTLVRLMTERRDSVSGVSLDEEMTDLIKYQRAFDASARVMQTLDEMLDTVVNSLGR